MPLWSAAGHLGGSVILAGLSQTRVGLTYLWLGRLISHPPVWSYSGSGEVREEVGKHMYFSKPNPMAMLRIMAERYLEYKIPGQRVWIQGAIMSTLDTT